MLSVVKILLITLFFFIIIGIGFFFYFSRNSGDFGFEYCDKRFYVGKSYVINSNKLMVISQLKYYHKYSDTIVNNIDSSFVIYLKNETVDFYALVRILEHHENNTIFRFDSIIGYSYPATLDSNNVNKLYDSKINELFKTKVIDRLSDKSIMDKDIYFDNYNIMNKYK